jgi:hypothetical protein
VKIDVLQPEVGGFLLNTAFFFLGITFTVAMNSRRIHSDDIPRVWPAKPAVQTQAIMDGLPPALRRNLARVMNRSLFAKVC